MRHLLLMSNSTQYGQPRLSHCADAIRGHLSTAGLAAGDPVLFVPWAKADLDAYTEVTRRAMEAVGFALDGIHHAADPVAAVAAARAIFVGGGNTFRLLDHLYGSGVMPVIRARVAEGLPYLGSSAGSNVACPTIRTTNDMPIVQPPSFDALGLVAFQLNPHYRPKDAGSTHMGESRDKRIAEFHEENERPVVGLREGAWLEIRGEQAAVGGLTGGVLFQRGDARCPLAPGMDLAQLIQV